MNMIDAFRQLGFTDGSILVLGRQGQLGYAFSQLLGELATVIDHEDLDLSKPETVYANLQPYQPKLIINAAAYTAVDKAEEQPALATVINGTAVGELARYAFDHNVPLLHYSTDYVFKGDGETPWTEHDHPAPLGAYGKSKRAGEAAIEQAAEAADHAHWLLFRVSWLYDAAHHNFVNTMLRLGTDREIISVVHDQIGAPTYAPDVAQASLEALLKAMALDVFPSGIYHMCNQGTTSWHGFAEAIFREASERGVALAIRDVKEIATKDYPTPATRPLNSRMSTQKLLDTFGITLPHWQDALQRCMQEKEELGLLVEKEPEKAEC